jgi:hypothetical protein
MSVRGQVMKTPCTVLVDSGAKGTGFVSLAFCRQLGLRVDESAAIRYRVADNVQSRTYGTADVPLRMQAHAFPVRCHVIDMLPAYSVILGDAWCLRTGAWLDYETRACSVRVGKKRVRLTTGGGGSAPPRAPREQPGTLISALDAATAMADDDTEVYLMVVTDAASPTASEPEQMLPGPPPLEQHTVDPVRLQAVLDKYRHICVDKLPVGLPPVRLEKEVAPLEPGAAPTCRPMFRYSTAELAEMERQVKELLAQGLIQPSSSPFGAPVLFVKKKGGELRMCIDYRALNRITVKNRYPLPRIDDLLDRVRGAKVFSSVDLCSAYHQCRLVDSDVPKSAFRTPFGHFEFRVLSFGLTNAPAHFQASINRCFDDSSFRKFCCVYLDDILVFSRSAEEHLQHLDAVFARLAAEQFYVKLRKCEFNKRQVQFLGHLVSAEGIRPDPAKVRTVLEWPQPKDVHELRSFLGLANYFRKFILAYGVIAAPLNALTTHFRTAWTDQELAAFQAVKEALSSDTCLAVPNPDAPFDVFCDASLMGIGAVLVQEGRPVAFESRKYIPAERNYTTTEQELLSVVHAFKTWRCYLDGAPQVTVFTDHRANTFLQTQPTLSRRQARWSEYLSGFRFQWRYLPGRVNVADPVSRAPQLAASLQEATVAALAFVGEGDDHALLPERSLTGLRPRLVASSASDPWLADGCNASDNDLLQRDGLWHRGSAIYVPASMRDECMALCHGAAHAGHLGVHKTHALCERYYW